MIIKVIFKSHFKVKKKFKKKNLKKKILVKNMLVLFLFSKIFFVNFTISCTFMKPLKKVFSLLKAPSRHKKYFHQLVIEYYKCAFFFKLKEQKRIDLSMCLHCFSRIEEGFFKKLGSNIFSRVKVLTLINTSV